MGVSNLPKVAWWCAGRELNPRPLDHESDTLTTAPPSHTDMIAFGLNELGITNSCMYEEDAATTVTWHPFRLKSPRVVFNR